MKPALMRCLACDRPLTKFAVSIPTRDGVRGWGPVCAKAVTIRKTRTRFPVADVAPRLRAMTSCTRDPLTPDLIDGAPA